MALCSKCCCCCCLSKKASAKVCTWLYILYIAINIGYNFLRNGYQDTVTIISSILQGLIIFSLIVLLIGFKTLNRPCLKQFKWIFGAYVIVQLIMNVVIITIYSILYKNSTNKSVIEEYRKKLEIINLTDNQIINTIRTLAISAIVGVCLFIILTLTYYFTTRSYVNELVGEISELNETRKQESGEK
ncbi:hypothetical protein H8356DRAFT_984061 [Neocallimastix lanati (nom. inval.)]|uniref:Uncharacterized protein n=1 Tax=Neocallimastix californiae TaxID=1754190 RepID=A0A1Y2FCU6_9FUNG|nr:hypothetical protein H8356DRAFT_984061 [Neocallimastix sp. JGI-2020a]ORY81731.1 hypothetical protein LY90DRAFT_664266 [Neocallimastix californiae]|eukprot:ORY81731.1 hypothetical protein LY90DRAFT_664266 [Neocallimastix californiae]